MSSFNHTEELKIPGVLCIRGSVTGKLPFVTFAGLKQSQTPKVILSLYIQNITYSQNEKNKVGNITHQRKHSNM